MTNFFADNLKYLRIEKKLSQNKLAELAKINQTTINRWESKEMSPNIDNINDIANVLNVSVADLLSKDLRATNNDTNSDFNEFTKLLKSKGIIDEKDTISQEDFDRLMTFIDNNKEFLIKNDRD